MVTDRPFFDCIPYSRTRCNQCKKLGSKGCIRRPGEGSYHGQTDGEDEASASSVPTLKEALPPSVLVTLRNRGFAVETVQTLAQRFHIFMYYSTIEQNISNSRPGPMMCAMRRERCLSTDRTAFDGALGLEVGALQFLKYFITLGRYKKKKWDEGTLISQ